MPFLLRYWRYLVVLALLVGIYTYAHHAGTTSERQKWEAKISEARQARIDDYEKQIANSKAAQAKAEADSATLAGTLASEQANYQRLQTALSRARMVIDVPPATPGACPTQRLSRSFRLCVTAAVTGASGDLADCEAIGMPRPATP